jgi:hypothetical protein
MSSPQAPAIIGVHGRAHFRTRPRLHVFQRVPGAGKNVESTGAVRKQNDQVFCHDLVKLIQRFATVKPLVELCKQCRLEAVFLVLECALFKLPVCPAKSANFIAPVAFPHVEMKLVFFKAIKAMGDPAEGLNDP